MENANNVNRNKNSCTDAIIKSIGIKNPSTSKEISSQKLEYTEATPPHNHMNTNIFSNMDVTRNMTLPKTQILVEIDGCKSTPYNPSSLIFTTAKIHSDNKTKNLEPVQVTPVPILSTIEVSMLNSKKSSNTVSTPQTITSMDATNRKEKQNKSEPFKSNQDSKISDTKLQSTVDKTSVGEKLSPDVKNMSKTYDELNPKGKQSFEPRTESSKVITSQQSTLPSLSGKQELNIQSHEVSDPGKDSVKGQKKNVIDNKSESRKVSNNTFKAGDSKTDTSVKQNISGVKNGVSINSSKSSKDTVSSMKQLPRQKAAIVEDADDIPLKIKPLDAQMNSSVGTAKEHVDVLKTTKNAAQPAVSSDDKKSNLKTCVVNSPIAKVTTTTISPMSSTVTTKTSIATSNTSVARPTTSVESKSISKQTSTPAVTKTATPKIDVKIETKIPSVAAVTPKPIPSSTMKSNEPSAIASNSTVSKQFVKSPLAKTTSVKTPTTEAVKVQSAVKSTVSSSTKLEAPTVTAGQPSTSTNNVAKLEANKKNGSKPNEFKKDGKSLNA